MVDMCKAYHISYAMFEKRITSYGWTLEEALTIPKNSSLGEVRIAKYLDHRKIEYYHDITIKRLFQELGIQSMYKEYLKDLVAELEESDNHFSLVRVSRMRFDFSLIRKKRLFAFVEYDGEQHFSWVDVFFKTLEEFLARHKADEVKTKISEAGQIPLLRIRYDQVDYIPEMIDHLLNNPSHYISNHNTYLSNEEYWSVFNANDLAGLI